MKCPSCGYENSDDARYCGLCQRSFVSSVNEPSAPYGSAPLQGLQPEPGQGAAKTVKKILRSQATGGNWFQRHLNWTWVFAQWAVSLILYVVVTVFVTSLVASGPNFPSEASLFASISVMQVISLVLELIAEFGVGAWVLKRKDRSLAWLLIFFVPLVGWIIFLCLQNRNLLEELPVSSGLSSSSEPSGSIQPGLASQSLESRLKYGP